MHDFGFTRSRTERRVVSVCATALCSLGFVSALWPQVAVTISVVLVVCAALAALCWLRRRGTTGEASRPATTAVNTEVAAAAAARRRRTRASAAPTWSASTRVDERGAA